MISISVVEINARNSWNVIRYLSRLGESQLRYFPGPQGSAPITHPEDELERLTKKMLFDMDNPPSEEYFGKEDHSSQTQSTNTILISTLLALIS